MAERIELFIDANVMLDYVERRRGNLHSIEVVERIKSDSRMLGVLSTFSLMEVEDQVQEVAYGQSLLNLGHTMSEVRDAARRRQLSSDECLRCHERVFSVLQSLGTRFTIRSPTHPEIWTLAAKLMQRTNLSAPDSVHVATAIATGCDGFVTGDEFLVEQVDSSRLTSSRLVTVHTQKQKSRERFNAEFEKALRKMEARRLQRPRANLPEDVEAMLQTFKRSVARGRDSTRVVTDYERNLRKGDSG